MSQKENSSNISTLLRKIKSKPLDRELGFGRNVTLDGRLMNPDGSFNVFREPIGRWDNTYYHLVTMPWRHFFLLIFSFFLLLNVLFSGLYLLIGVEHFNGVTLGSPGHNFMQAFFFSSQTLTTVGYGHISPNGLVISLLASFESFLGLLAFALMTGLLYGRFSRPAAKIVFSEKLLISPYKVGKGLMFRMGNASKSELIETEVQVLMAYNQREEDGSLSRKFYPLGLEINKISFFSLSWTIVHPLDENSPIFNFSEQDILDANAEIMVLVKGTDETAQQLVHARRSYSGEEIVWNARFSPVIERAPNGVPRVLTRRIGEHELLSIESV
ncbi:MAG: ion transporter [Phycisphaerae bacterium]|nr:ion transporter [Saprospiraceae bacterium]